MDLTNFTLEWNGKSITTMIEEEIVRCPTPMYVGQMPIWHNGVKIRDIKLNDTSSPLIIITFV